MNVFDLRSDTHAIEFRVADHDELRALFKQFDETEQQSRQAAQYRLMTQAQVSAPLATVAVRRLPTQKFSKRARRPSRKAA